MKIYTRTGDAGQTSVIGGRRDKDDVRIEAYGTLDELNAFVQQALSKMPAGFESMKTVYNEISHLLFDCISDLADAINKRPARIAEEHIAWLEELIDEYKGQVEPTKAFILPGGCELSSTVHICRTITRRAERRIVTLAKAEEINIFVMKFVNRLSDYFFISAHLCNKKMNVESTNYKRSKNVFR